MPEQPLEVGYMKKIALAVTTGLSGQDPQLNSEPVALDFIFGVGTQGLSLFEKALFGKCPGDDVVVNVSAFQVNEALGDLKQRLQTHLPSASNFILKASVKSVETPSEREVVRAIAAAVGSHGCDCGGSCGCGC